jgi:hypothetical protein
MYFAVIPMDRITDRIQRQYMGGNMMSIRNSKRDEMHMKDVKIEHFTDNQKPIFEKMMSPRKKAPKKKLSTSINLPIINENESEVEGFKDNIHDIIHSQDFVREMIGFIQNLLSKDDIQTDWSRSYKDQQVSPIVNIEIISRKRLKMIWKTGLTPRSLANLKAQNEVKDLVSNLVPNLFKKKASKAESKESSSKAD